MATTCTINITFTDDITVKTEPVNQQRWITFSEKNPNYPSWGETVLVCDDKANMFIARHISGEFGVKWYNETNFECIKSSIVAWMPLPKPYEVD